PAGRIAALARRDGVRRREAGLGPGARGVRARRDWIVPHRGNPDGRMMREMDRDTQIVHAGFRKRSDAGPFLQGPQFSSTYTSPGEPSDNELTYGRFHNPTWTAWQDALRLLQEAGAVPFAPGTPPPDPALGLTLRHRHAAVLAAHCYHTL